MSELSSRPELNRYQMIRSLGRGSFGRVYLAEDQERSSYFAIKVLSQDLEQSGISHLVLREVSILQELRHPNIIQLLEVIPTMDRLFLVFEYFESDLRSVLETGQLNSSQIKHILIQILEALCLCEERRVIHRDLKPDNILVNQNLDVKIADFGMARWSTVKGGPYTNEVQTLWYRAPEVLLGCNRYSFAIDVWSAGCIFAELILRRPLFMGNSPLQQIELIRNHEIPIDDLDAKDLLDKMLSVNPVLRISPGQALLHPYLSANN